MLLLRSGEQDADGDFVRAGRAVSQLRNGGIIAVAHLEVVLLHTHHKDESIRVLYTIAIPHSHEEGHPVEIQTIVEVMETTLILIDKVGRDNRLAEAKGGLATSLLRNINQTTCIGRQLDGDRVFTIETLTRLVEVVGNTMQDRRPYHRLQSRDRKYWSGREPWQKFD